MGLLNNRDNSGEGYLKIFILVGSLRLERLGFRFNLLGDRNRVREVGSRLDTDQADPAEKLGATDDAEGVYLTPRLCDSRLGSRM